MPKYRRDVLAVVAATLTAAASKPVVNTVKDHLETDPSCESVQTEHYYVEPRNIGATSVQPTGRLYLCPDDQAVEEELEYD